MKENKNLNPFDFSKKIIRLTDNDMNKVTGGANSGCSDGSCCAPEPDTCTQGPSCEPDTCTVSPSCSGMALTSGFNAANLSMGE